MAEAKSVLATPGALQNEHVPCFRFLLLLQAEEFFSQNDKSRATHDV